MCKYTCYTSGVFRNVYEKIKILVKIYLSLSNLDVEVLSTGKNINFKLIDSIDTRSLENLYFKDIFLPIHVKLNFN